jgi:hypothetical protein
MAGSYDAIVYTMDIIVPENLLGVASTSTLCMTVAAKGADNNITIATQSLIYIVIFLLSIQGYSSPFTLGDLKCDFKEAQRCTPQDIGRDERSTLEQLEVIG